MTPSFWQARSKSSAVKQEPRSVSTWVTWKGKARTASFRKATAEVVVSSSLTARWTKREARSMATYRYRLRLSPLSAGRAPYGYRYVPRQDVVPGHLVVDEPEAELVRMLYGWLVDEQTTIRQILKRLNAGPWLPRSGRHAWSPSTVHHIRADPIYVGTAYANRYAYVPYA